MEQVDILGTVSAIASATSSEDTKETKAALRLCSTINRLAGRVDRQLSNFRKTTDPLHLTTAESFLPEMRQLLQAAQTVDPPPPGQKATPRRKTKKEKK
jgi:hypothetical protein